MIEAEPLPPELQAGEVEVPRRRGRWVIPLMVVIALLVALFFVAEWIGRMMLQGAARAAIDQAGIEVSGDVEVSVPGLLIPQAITGSLDEVAVTATGVTIESVSADVDVTALDVSIADRVAGSVTVVARTNADGVHGLLAETADGPVWDALGGVPEVSFVDDLVRFSAELSLLGVEAPLEADVRPGVADGQLALGTEAITLAGARLDHGSLERLPSGLASALSEPIPVCLDGTLPRAVTLTAAEVAADELVLTADVDGRVLADPALRQRGSCE